MALTTLCDENVWRKYLFDIDFTQWRYTIMPNVNVGIDQCWFDRIALIVYVATNMN